MIRMNDGCGRRCVEFARLSNLDGCWLKTSSGFCQQVMFGENCSEAFCETWPRSGMVTSSGIAYRLPSAERVTSAPGSGFWPTPQASDNRDRGNLSTPAIQRRLSRGKQLMLSMVVSHDSGRLNPEWVEWLMGYPIGFSGLRH